MEISPLAEHVDMQEHYIAFVDLKAFGLEPSSSLPRSYRISLNGEISMVLATVVYIRDQTRIVTY